jgi:hypothetical protein
VKLTEGELPSPANLRNGALILLLCVIGIFQLATIQPGMVGGEDSALYLLHARNVAFHRPYLATGYVYSSETARYSPAGYPPVFPIMLAPLFRHYGVNPAPYKVLMACIVVLCVLAIAWLYVGEMTQIQLFVFLVLVGFNPFITEQKNEILSDLPFVLFLTLAFLCFRNQTKLETENWRYFIRGVVAGFVTYLAYGTRAVGLGLILAIVVLTAVRYRKLPRLVVVAIAVFACLAGLQAALLSINSDYLRIATFTGHSPVENLRFYAGVASLFWDAGIGRLARLMVFAVATCLCLVGGWQQRKSWDLPMVFSCGYAMFLIFCPYHQARYLLPLVPIYFYYLVLGLGWLNNLVVRRLPRTATVTALVLVAPFVMTYIGNYLTPRFGPTPDAWDGAAARQLYALVERSTPKDAVIIASAPRALALYTLRRSAQFPERVNAQSLARYVAEIRATHLLVPRVTADQWASLCGSACVPEPISSNADYVLYKTTLSLSEETHFAN